MIGFLRSGLTYLYFINFKFLGKSKNYKQVLFNTGGIICFAITFLKHLERRNPLFMKISALRGMKMCAKQALIALMLNFRDYKNDY